MSIVGELQKAFIEKMDAFKTVRSYLDKRIEFRKKQIERLEKRRDKVAWLRWDKEIVEPLAREIAKEFPGCKYRVNGPFGLGSTTTILITDGSETLFYLSIRPGNLSSVSVSGDRPFTAIDYSVVDKEFPPNSLGTLNNLQYKEVPINDMSVEELIQWGRDMLKRCEEQKDEDDEGTA